jgi:hypothetical protein
MFVMKVLIVPARVGVRVHLLFVIPAKAGLRRQDAEANVRAANGPCGARQEPRVIQHLLANRSYKSCGYKSCHVWFDSSMSSILPARFHSLIAFSPDRDS